VLLVGILGEDRITCGVGGRVEDTENTRDLRLACYCLGSGIILINLAVRRPSDQRRRAEHGGLDLRRGSQSRGRGGPCVVCVVACAVLRVAASPQDSDIADD